MIDDAVLPAAAHLTGADADGVLRAAVAASGAELVSCRPVHVQYRPGSDLIVRYAGTVRGADGSTSEDTLLAGVTRHGPHPGTVPVEATTASGGTLSAGVWRWPFDPVLADLGQIVTPARAEHALRAHVRGPLSITVVVYRPAERVVVRVVDADGLELYVKLVAPTAVSALVERHARLADVGLPIPEIVATGASWIAMRAIHGPTLRDVIKGMAPSSERLPGPEAIVDVCERIANADLADARPVRPRLLDAAAHARMLATVLHAEHDRLGALAERFDRIALAATSRDRRVIHGDLHEGQMIVSNGSIVGLLDIDDAGPGDPVDDMATLLGHLRYRMISSGRHGIDRPGVDLTGYADGLRRSFVDAVDGDALDAATAGVLVGLATGPFRVQQRGWESAVTRVLDEVDRTLSQACRR